MSNRFIYGIAGTVGSLIGGYMPALWGAGELSGWGILLGTIGGVIGIVLAYKYIVA